MAASTAPGLQIGIARPTLSSSRKFFAAFSVADSKGRLWTKLTSSSHISSFQFNLSSAPMKSGKAFIRAMAEASEKSPVKGKKALIAGVADHDNGYGWALGRSLAAEILVGNWVSDTNVEG